jgi:hypothetical protein
MKENWTTVFYYAATEHYLSAGLLLPFLFPLYTGLPKISGLIVKVRGMYARASYGVNSRGYVEPTSI